VPRQPTPRQSCRGNPRSLPKWRPTMAMHDLVTAYTVSNAVEAEIIKNALIEEGIHCEIEGENQAGEAGLTGIEIKLQVPEADVARARDFIAHDDSLSDDEPVGEEHKEGIQPI